MAQNFLQQQKDKIEEEIQKSYMQKNPKQLMRYLNHIESKEAFKSLMDIKHESLIQMKQQFNQVDFEVQKARTRNEKIDEMLRRYQNSKGGQNEEENEDVPMKDDLAEESVETQIDLLNLVHHQLQNQIEQYKFDIITQKKNIQFLKESMGTLKKKFKQKGFQINTMEDGNNNMINRFQIKQNLQLQHDRTQVNKEVENQLTKFQEEIKIVKILQNETKIQEAIKQQHNQEAQREQNKKMQELQHKKEVYQEDLSSISSSIQSLRSTIKLLMDKFSITEQDQILSKI